MGGEQPAIPHGDQPGLWGGGRSSRGSPESMPVVVVIVIMIVIVEIMIVIIVVAYDASAKLRHSCGNQQKKYVPACAFEKLNHGGSVSKSLFEPSNVVESCSSKRRA